MCGIVGMIGRRGVTPTLLEGLKSLEYRGYDSAGMAVMNGSGRIELRKEAGPVARLEAALEGFTAGSVGIAHTRWATHGPPTRENAHPHLSDDGRFAIVHNGIIENHAVLRRYLIERGVTFNSQTDSEVIVQLIAHEARAGAADPVREALLRLEGTFGLLVLDRERPDRLLAARRGSPLIIGVDEGAHYIASDAAALVRHTRRVVYLEDGELAELTADSFRTATFADGQPVAREPSSIDWEIAAIEKGGHPHFMLKEIFEQPESLRNCCAGRLRPEEGRVHLGGIAALGEDFIRSLRRVVLTGCGTAWHAGLVGEYALEELARLPVEVEYASELRYRNPVLGPGDLIIAISQSGETADTLAALREARMRGAQVMGICNVVGSTIAREAGLGVYTHAGPEIGVASTKAFSTQVATLVMLAIQWGRLRGSQSAESAAALAGELVRVPELIGRVCAGAEQIRAIAQALADSTNALYLGRGINFPVALEGALKLKEISYIHAEGYPAAEMKHGPIALIDRHMPVVVIATGDGHVRDKVMANIEEIRARSGRVIAIADEEDAEIAAHAEHVIRVPRVATVLSPLINVVPLQLLAYYIAAERGCEIDRPRNLAKSVTVE